LNIKWLTKTPVSQLAAESDLFSKYFGSTALKRIPPTVPRALPNWLKMENSSAFAVKREAEKNRAKREEKTII